MDRPQHKYEQARGYAAPVTRELVDYQMKMMLLDQQNKKRLVLAQGDETTDSKFSKDPDAKPAELHYTISEDRIDVHQGTLPESARSPIAPSEDSPSGYGVNSGTRPHALVGPRAPPVTGTHGTNQTRDTDDYRIYKSRKRPMVQRSSVEPMISGSSSRVPDDGRTRKRPRAASPSSERGDSGEPDSAHEGSRSWYWSSNEEDNGRDELHTSKNVNSRYSMDLWPRDTLVGCILKLQAKLRSNHHSRNGQKRWPAITIATFHVVSRPPNNAKLFSDNESEAEDNNEAWTTYLDEPGWVVSKKACFLKARSPVVNPSNHAKQGGVALAIYHIYSEPTQRPLAEEAMSLNQPLPAPIPNSHKIELISDEMYEAVKVFLDAQPGFRSTFKNLRERDGLHSPFAWWYHRRTQADVSCLTKQQAELVSVLTTWLDENYGPLFDACQAQLNRGKVSKASMNFLIQPGDVLVSTDDNGYPQGHTAMTAPFKSWTDSLRDRKGGTKHCWRISCRTYSYQGDFFWSYTSMDIPFDAKSQDQEVDIASLKLVPIALADDKVRELLRRRGEIFWRCRAKHFVSYKGNLQHGKHAGQRFMVDFQTYNELHPDNPYAKLQVTNGKALDLPDMSQNQPPGEPQIYLFPPSIPGFDLRYKKWVDLEVDRIRDVEWKQDAFNSLVFDEDMKDIILALVTNQLEAGKGTDLIDNKGNGLIMLLHGSPGTGKTYTAESVAEIARKPLYPVTCGDIGTEPEKVEKYLERVFHLGKVWDCVVLLDEAEIFLEQRTLSDLKRNALVSVFLRALEYYEGILILTTNRVGTFDEAFKSRIQLALRYEKLAPHQRKQIWRNFLTRLKALGEEDRIDFDEVTLRIDDLVKYPMNGRQIRNTITTARQLAKFMGNRMGYTHLQRAITVGEKFDMYLARVREGDVKEEETKENGRYTDDFFARSDQIR